MITIRQTDLFRSWFQGLRDEKVKARINVRLQRLALGHVGDAKAVGSGVYELRLQFGPGYRIYYTVQGSDLVILLIGGDKSTQRSDIAKAIALTAKI